MNAFQQWMDKRYPFASGRPWNRTFLFLALNSPERAWAAFYDALDAFHAGLGPDSLSRTAQEIVKNITKQVLLDRPDADPDAIAAAFRDRVKDICPS